MDPGGHIIGGVVVVTTNQKTRNATISLYFALSEAKRSVVVARCASSSGVLGDENAAGIQVHFYSFGTFSFSDFPAAGYTAS